jgi:hypothetical protein
MRNRILGGIVAIWGAAILIKWLASGAPTSGGAYGAGQIISLVFSALMLGFGLYYLITGGGSAEAENKQGAGAVGNRPKR